MYSHLPISQMSGELATTYAYDPAGNMIRAGNATYTYDAANRMVRYTDPQSRASGSYAYNGTGARYAQTVNGVTTTYLLDLNAGLTQVLGETTGNEDSWYLLGLDVIAQQQNGTWGYFGYDGLGSVRQITDSDGLVQYAANYDPYGLPIEQGGLLGSAFGFTGEQTDANNLIYLRARYYSPALGIFQSKDPFAGWMTRAMSRNGYSYVEGNPVNYTDPSGKLLPFMLAGTVIGSVVAAAIDITAQLSNNGGRWDCIDVGQLGRSMFLGALAGAFMGFGGGLWALGSAGTGLAVLGGNAAVTLAVGKGILLGGIYSGIASFIGTAFANYETGQNIFDNLSVEGLATSVIFGGILGGISGLVGATIVEGQVTAQHHPLVQLFMVKPVEMALHVALGIGVASAQALWNSVSSSKSITWRDLEAAIWSGLTNLGSAFGDIGNGLGAFGSGKTVYDFEKGNNSKPLFKYN